MILREQLKKFSVKFEAPLSDYTFTRVGGPAEFLVFPRNLEEIRDVLKLARATSTPLTILGNSSNLIVRDGGIRGLVIMLCKLASCTVENNQVEAGAGLSLSALTERVAQYALTGFEFACGIPGSVGGAVYMNAGAYGGEIKDVFHSAMIMDYGGTIKKLYRAEMGFAYRRSIVRDKNWIILSAKFELKPGRTEEIQKEMKRLTVLRRSKQPLEYPSCGSVFKRPEGHFTGPLIQEAGCQGHRIGGVEVSMQHAGFMVNVNHGTAHDYEALIEYVIEKVKAHSGLVLEPEVRIIGDPLC